ncbi:MAG TPA: sigma 54-interacting transcriptional regulator [Gemmatales bacterium]|nr:sigma 54-interacting transcriptional regulator [Gemmatales bacterium]
MAQQPPLRLIADPKQLLLDMAREHKLADLLQLIVTRFGDSPQVALTRIWLIKPGDICSTCLMRPECPSQERCLHLVASAGHSMQDKRIEWSGLSGSFRRFPLGIRKVGKIAATGEALEVPNIAETPDWIARPEWISSEGVSGFGGQPLVHHGKVFGVLAVFARGTIGPECMGWLRTIANHAAAAIATARAFDEIESLKKQLELENEYLREEVSRTGAFGELIGQSPALETVTRQIDLVAKTDSSVLILGESGTGKELVAHELHRRSNRASKPFIKVNCAAVPRELYESEFFGHAKGAFTGALRDRTGRFELADGGTLFLDEIGEIPLELQAKLLRVLQEGELERVGEERTRKINVRLIAATNRDLRLEAEAGRFRQDLYYRLSVFPIDLPPLRKRLEDIPLLAQHFLSISATKLARSKLKLTLANVQQLQQYDWPGNVRELQHVIERAVITAEGNRMTINLQVGMTASASRKPSTVESVRVMTDAELKQLEADNIRTALKLTKGKVSGSSGAAELLGIKPTTLTSRIKTLGIGQSP